MTKEEILESKTMVEVVTSLGLKPNRGGFIKCPFHSGDNHASLKLYPKSFYCFGCGKGGDVFTFVQLYQSCDFHTAFLLLGGTDRTKGARPSRRETIELYRAKKAREAKEKRDKEQRQQLKKIGAEIDFWRDKLRQSEPLTEDWANAYNHWQIACYQQAEICGKDLDQL